MTTPIAPGSATSNVGPVMRLLSLDQVDLDTPTNRRRHLRLIAADAVREEDGDPDGCSPWSCRSGEPVADAVVGEQVA